MLFYKALPFLITLASNIIYRPQIQENLLCHLLYVNEKADWIGYRNRSYCYRIRDMQKKSADIKKVMGDLRGCIIRSKNDTREMRNCMDEAQVSERNGNNSKAPSTSS